MLLTTTDTVPGATIGCALGMVLACVPYFGTKYGEGIADLLGNTATDIPAVLEARRREVLERLSTLADHLGADAVVAVRLTEREINDTWKEICAYGTAIKLA